MGEWVDGWAFVTQEEAQMDVTATGLVRGLNKVAKGQARAILSLMFF